MARNATADRAKVKARKQKQLAIVLSAVLVVLLAVQGPKTMKLLKGAPKAPVVTASSTQPPPSSPAPAAVASSLPASPVTATPQGQLVSAVQATVDPGQLREFNRFASKDPFAAQVAPSVGAPAQSATPASPKGPATPKAPATPPPTSAVISLNGELMSVLVNGAFPTSGTTFNRVGSLFQLVSLTRTSAKVTVVGGSYANGAPALTLAVGKPVTLQNTADGTRYTLVLEPQGTQVPPPVVATVPAGVTPPAAPPTTTPVVPAGTGG